MYGKCGENLVWTLYNGTLTIIGKGEMENYYMFGNSPPWYSVSIERIVIKDGITNIGDVAFKSCWQLKRIEIPKNVTMIGLWALSYCTNLQDVKISEGLKTISEGVFYGCTSLKKITIPESVNRIGERAFSYCNSLTEIKIPVNIKELGINVFSGCTALKKIYYPADFAFVDKLRCGNNAELISYNKLCWKVEEKTLTVGGVREIKYYSYKDLPWLDNISDIQKIVIEDGVKKIYANAFIECTRLELVSIPETVKTIGDFAFNVSYCGEITMNNGKNVIWSLTNGVLMIKKNPAAKSDADFSTGYERWKIVDKNIKSVKIERGVILGKRFYDWLNRMNSNLPVAFL